MLTLLEPILQNGQTHSNNSSAICLSVFDHFVGLALKGLIIFAKCPILDVWESAKYASGLNQSNCKQRSELHTGLQWHFSRWRQKLRSSRPEMFCKKVFLKISQNSQEIICARVSFFNKVADLRPAFLLKKRLWHRCFRMNFVKFLKISFLQNTSG